jgi:apolipoprotein N-acyltransferase
LGAYLGIYPTLWVALARMAVHRCRVPLVLAAPLVWIGLELVRGHALTGFSMALLGHTQIPWLSLIQIADLAGAYAVSFLVMFGAACLFRCLPRSGVSSLGTPAQVGRERERRVWTVWPAVVFAAVLAVVVSYGVRQLRTSPNADRPALRAALIQASFDTIFDADPERAAETFLRYRQLSLDAVHQHPDLDLIVWPESAFTGTVGEPLVEGDVQPPPELALAPDEYVRALHEWTAQFQAKVRGTARKMNDAGDRGTGRSGVSLLVGADSQRVSGVRTERYNSALLIDPAGEIAGRYYKMHLVAFGEYVPFAETFPWLYRVQPIPYSLTAGRQPEVFRVAGLRIAPSICFESTVPHLIRRQLATLEAQGENPDVLVNVTNDGWFWGSGILDLHLACAVFRAVEFRRPFLVAANTGLSAQIDANGRIVARGPRRAEQVLVAEVRVDHRGSWYQWVGDLPAGLCVLFCVVVAIVGLTTRRLPANAGERLE